MGRPARPEVAISVSAEPLPRWSSLEVRALPDLTEAVLRVSSAQPQRAVGEPFEARLGGAVLVAGAIRSVEVAADNAGVWTYRVESDASWALRSPDDRIGPASMRGVTARQAAAAILAGLQTDLAAIPERRFDAWTLPRCSRQWALMALRRALAWSGAALHWIVDPAGTVRAGEHVLRRSGITLGAGDVLASRQRRYTVRALAVGPGDTLSLAGREMVCHASRTTLRGGDNDARYRTEVHLWPA